MTFALCDHWKHESACRWPHNSAIDNDVVPASFRMVFVAEPSDEQQIRARIDGALRGVDGWAVASSGPRGLDRDEEPLGENLAHMPIP